MATHTNSMYNETLKKRYVEEKQSAVILPSNYLYCQFNKSEKYESLIEKDISNFTVYEILDYYKSLNVSSIDSLFVMNNQLSMYTQWCLQQNIVMDCQNHFLEVTRNLLKTCINKLAFTKKIISRETVLSWIDETINPKDAFVLLCLFEGIKGKDFCEIVKIRMSDFHGNKLTLCTGREVTVSDKLIELAQESDSATEYYSISGGQSKKMPLKDIGGYVIKGYPNQRDDVSDFQKGRVCYGGLMRAFAYLGVDDWMSANALAESGKIYYIKKRSADLNMTPMEFIYSPYIKEIEQQYNYKVVKSVYWDKYKECLA